MGGEKPQGMQLRKRTGGDLRQQRLTAGAFHCDEERRRGWGLEGDM